MKPARAASESRRPLGRRLLRHRRSRVRPCGYRRRLARVHPVSCSADTGASDCFFFLRGVCLAIVLRLFLVSRSPPLAGHLAGRSARPPAGSPPSQSGFRGRPQRWGQIQSRSSRVGTDPARAASRHVSRAVGDHSGPPAGPVGATQQQRK